MRDQFGGPDSKRSYVFWKNNGFKDVDGFLASWKQKDPPKEKNHRGKQRKRAHSTPIRVERARFRCFPL